MDMNKYRNLFLEEAAEQLAEISRALLELEKHPTGSESIEVIFRMAHSIKSMAASLGYESITEIAHRLEDRMEGIRSAAAVGSAEELALLFRGLEGLERMVAAVRDTGEAPGADPELAEALVVGGEGSSQGVVAAAPKKAPTP